MWVNAAGDVFIADSGNQRIREVTGTGSSAVINTVLGGGNGGDNGAATSAELAQPYAVALDSNNNYYIADTANNRVRVVNTQTSAITVANRFRPAWSDRYHRRQRRIRLCKRKQRNARPHCGRGMGLKASR